MTQTLPFLQIDAFASKAFEGNQACVMPLSNWSLTDEMLQAIAAENNVSETAYIVQTAENVWDLRWFTPAVEVPLCGHATLAAAHALFHHEGFAGEEIAFDTRQSGRLTVKKLDATRLEMDFPAPKVRQLDNLDAVEAALGTRPVEVWGGPFIAAVFDDPAAITALSPEPKEVAALVLEADEGWDRGNVGCLAAGGDGVDVTSRFFAPGSGIDEDPATGSWHCMLAAVMAPKLGKSALDCFQAYPGRGAYIGAELAGDRVKLRGQAVTVIEGVFRL
ncbi:MAG: PhzF family phenazine biosynthesis protein [Pseudomonadota bacterium]